MVAVRIWSWLWVGMLIALVPAYLGPLAGRAGGPAMAAAVGIAVVLVAGAWWLWTREQARRSSPRSEYLVVAFLGTYYASAGLFVEPDGRLLDWVVFLVPVSFLPLLLRLSLGDDGRPSTRGRRAARGLHLVLGVGFLASAIVMGATVWLLAVVPIVAIPAVLHLMAARFYRPTVSLGDRR